MGRAIIKRDKGRQKMKISVDTKREFIPEWHDNKLADESQRIVIEHRAPSMTLVEDLIPKPTLKMTGHGDVTDGWETTSTMDSKKLIRGMLLKIRNLTLDVDGKDMPIVGYEDLYSPATPSIVAGLVDEIAMYFQKILSERKTDVKN
jgi:hypothetical protein